MRKNNLFLSPRTTVVQHHNKFPSRISFTRWVCIIDDDDDVLLVAGGGE